MDILKPNSSMPAVHDGLHVYTGSWYVGDTGRARSVQIRTQLRQIMCANIYSTYVDTDSGDELHQVTHLNYEVGVDSIRKGLIITVIVPAGQTLYYHITGSQDLKPLAHPEQYSNMAAEAPNKFMHLESIISVAGNSAVEIVNTANSEFTYSKGGTGIYTIESSEPFFTPDSIFFIQHEGTGGLLSGLVYTFTGDYVDANNFVIRCYSVDVGPSAPPTNANGRIIFSIKSKPDSF
jgi:hypothetical protein